jgi:hypothetical protein
MRRPLGEQNREEEEDGGWVASVMATFNRQRKGVSVEGRDQAGL